jgi:hypothetical protein
MSHYDVPCGSCTLCCYQDAVRLLPEDDVTQYLTEPHAYFPGALMLAHKANGDCIYLGSQGCTIHATKPLMCKEADCRNIAKNITWTTARKLSKQGRLRMPVWKRGKELLHMEEL